MTIIDRFENMLASGQDSALLRFSLGQAYWKDGRFDKAVEHLEQAVHQDPQYSAAWKVFGKALAEVGRTEDAIAAYTKGIEVAEHKGDIQAAKEMKVFRKRLQRSRDNE